MKLISINQATPRQLEYRQQLILTGIFKEPVAGPITVTDFGIEGDVQVDRENHGGKDKAIYVYTVENYRFWQTELGREAFPHGQFGENFTVSEMPDEEIHIGDIFQIGAIIVQVTQPRVPCFKLEIKMEYPQFVESFLRSGRVGFYLRILQEGLVNAGDCITRLREDQEKLNIRDAMLAMVKGPRQQEIIERALRVEALSDAWRADLTKRLNRLSPLH